MRALQVTELSGPTGLALRRVDAPAAGEDVVIDVHTAGVTFPDLLLTYGIYHVRPDLPFAPGLEVGGIVRSAPEGADVAAGDRVIAYTGHGGYAEAVSAPAHCVVPLPDSVDFVSGVSLMVNYQTAYLGVVERGHLRADETLLVHGAAGGVGTAAIQIGRSVGARVLAVVSDEAKAAVASRAGAEEIVFTGNWVEEVRERTAATGVDVVFDPVGGDRFDDSLRLLRPGGRLLIIGFAEGRIPQIASNRLLLRNIAAVGVAWGPLIPFDHDMPRRIGRAVNALLADGHVRPVIGDTYALEDGNEALRDMEARRTVGKSVLLVNP